MGYNIAMVDFKAKLKDVPTNPGVYLMLDKDGSMILFLRDFDQPPFLPEWWEDPFDPTFFGLGYRFEKAAQ